LLAWVAIGSLVATGVAWGVANTVESAPAAPIAVSVTAAPVPGGEEAPPPVTSVVPPSPAYRVALVAPSPAHDELASTMGSIRVTVAGRRVFLDGHVAGNGPRT